MVIDLSRPYVERSPKDSRKCQHIVDLVGKIAAPGGNHRRSARPRFIRVDLRSRICTGKHNGVSGHRPYHFLRYRSRRADADKYIRPNQHVFQAACSFFPVGDPGHLFFYRIHSFRPAFINGAFPVAQDQMPDTIGQKQPGYGNGCRSCPVHDHPDFIHFLAHHFQRVHQARQCNDRRSVLVVMKDRNITAFLEFFLNLKAARRRNVFQVDSAKAAGNLVNGFHNGIYILAFDTHGKCIYIPKCFEQGTFSFHNRHAGFRPDVAQSQHG